MSHTQHSGGEVVFTSVPWVQLEERGGKPVLRMIDGICSARFELDGDHLLRLLDRMQDAVLPLAERGEAVEGQGGGA